MGLTRRGWTAVAVVVLSVGLAWSFGERSLNAVAAPTVAALVVAAVSIRRADPPTVTVEDPRAGFPGETRTISVTVEGEGIARIRQSVPAGLSGQAVDVTGPLPRSFDHAVTLDARGVYELGPPEVRQRDPLGLLERRVPTETTAQLVVYPQVYVLSDPTLGGVLADPMTAERQEFDRLREYVSGDPLKNVHWKSSAKYDEFLVMEFAPTERTETLRIAAEAEPGGADRMAGAAATLADAALAVDLKVELLVPDGHLPAGTGETHRENVMRLLATTGHGSVDGTDLAEADVAIDAGPRSTVVGLPEGPQPFDALVTGRRERTDSAVVRDADTDGPDSEVVA